MYEHDWEGLGSDAAALIKMTSAYSLKLFRLNWKIFQTIKTSNC